MERSQEIDHAELAVPGRRRGKAHSRVQVNLKKLGELIRGLSLSSQRLAFMLARLLCVPAFLLAWTRVLCTASPLPVAYFVMPLRNKVSASGRWADGTLITV
jgi:hypothetical protein